MTQLALRPDWAGIWSEYRRLLRDSVDHVGVKQAAGELDVAPSMLSNSFEERDRHRVRAEWTGYLVVQAPDDRAVEFLAALRGLECVPEKRRSPAEELNDIKAAISDLLPPEMRQVIYQRAKKGRR